MHPPMASHHVARTLLTRDQIQDRIIEMASEIERDTPGDTLIHLVCVLKGGFMFLADLVRAMGDRVTMDFIAVSSYGKGTRTSGQVRLLKDLDHSIEGRDVIIVEDIVDTGLTLTYLQEILRARARAAAHGLSPQQAVASPRQRPHRLHRLQHR